MHFLPKPGPAAGGLARPLVWCGPVFMDYVGGVVNARPDSVHEA